MKTTVKNKKNSKGVFRKKAPITTKKPKTTIRKKKVVKKVAPIKETAKGKRNRRTSNEFIGRFAKNWYDGKKLEKIADMLYDFMSDPKNFWMKDFATENGFTPNIFPQFCRENDYFNKVYQICKAIQESKIIKIGIKGRPQLPIFLLRSVHNMRDEIREKESTIPEIPDVDNMSPEEIDRLYKRILDNE